MDTSDAPALQVFELIFIQLSCQHLLSILLGHLECVCLAIPYPDVHVQHTLKLLVQGSHAGGGAGQDES